MLFFSILCVCFYMYKLTYTNRLFNYYLSITIHHHIGLDFPFGEMSNLNNLYLYFTFNDIIPELGQVSMPNMKKGRESTNKA